MSRELVKVPFVSQQNSFGHCAPSDLIWSLNKFQPLWPSLLPPLFHCDKSLFVLCANSSWGIAPQVAPPAVCSSVVPPDHRCAWPDRYWRHLSQDYQPRPCLALCLLWLNLHFFFSCCFIWFSLLFHTFTFNQLNYFDFWLEFRNYCGLGWNPSHWELQLSHVLHCQKTPCFTRWRANVTDLQGNGATESPR